MSWWNELSHTGRELVAMFAMFFGVVGLVLTISSLTPPGSWWRK